MVKFIFFCFNVKLLSLEHDNTMLNGKRNDCDIGCQLALPDSTVYMGHLGILLKCRC